MIPLILRLKKSAHKDIALAQDLIVGALYEAFNDAVLHGGTSIWRCYKGNRFSEDVDVYIPKNIAKVDDLFNTLLKRGFNIKKKKVAKNSIFSTLYFERTIVRFEAIFKKVEGSLKEYETIDGNFITVYTLEPGELVAEKTDAYIRRLKIRDIYDIFFLLRYVKSNKEVKAKIKKLISNFKKPIDEGDLKVLIFEGLVPSSEKMINYIRNWSQDGKRETS